MLRMQTTHRSQSYLARRTPASMPWMQRVLIPSWLLAISSRSFRGSPWSRETVKTRLLFPPPKTRPTSQDAYDSLPENSPWRAGPWLEELDVETRDTLASVEDARLPELVARWEKIEALSEFDDPSSLLPLLEELVDLARKARKANSQLYCWS